MALLPAALPHPMVAFLVVLLKTSVLAYSLATFLLLVDFLSAFDRIDHQLLFELSSLGSPDATLPESPLALLTTLSQIPCYLFLFLLTSKYWSVPDIGFWTLLFSLSATSPKISSSSIIALGITHRVMIPKCAFPVRSWPLLELLAQASNYLFVISTCMVSMHLKHNRTKPKSWFALSPAPRCINPNLASRLWCPCQPGCSS